MNVSNVVVGSSQIDPVIVNISKRYFMLSNFNHINKYKEKKN